MDNFQDPKYTPEMLASTYSTYYAAIVLCFITETVTVKIKPPNSWERRTESATVSIIVVETTT